MAAGDAATLRRDGPAGPEVIDGEGGLLLPGFHDGHIHLLASAARRAALDCAGARSFADLAGLVRARAARLPRGAWVRAAGYDETALREGRHPDRRLLDAAAPHHPVRLQHRSYHACVANSLALRLAGITAETPEPPGGVIDRDLDTGEPSGLLLETAQDLLRPAIPPPSPAELREGVHALSRRLLAWGITALQDATASNGADDADLFRELQASGALRQRVTLMMGSGSVSAGGAGWGTATKIILDESTGRLHPSPADLDRQVLAVHRAGGQVAMHAVTATALDAALDAVERAQQALPRPDARHRVEHCSICTPAQAARIARLGVHVCTQPGFIHESGDRYLRDVPDPADLYPVRRLMTHGVPVCGGSDSPIASPNPFAALHAAVTRRSASGNLVSAEQAVDLRAAVSMYTDRAAAAAFLEHDLGRIAAGYRADLVLVPHLVPEGLLEVRPRLTVLGGEIAWGGRSQVLGSP